MSENFFAKWTLKEVEAYNARVAAAIVFREKAKSPLTPAHGSTEEADAYKAKLVDYYKKQKYAIPPFTEPIQRFREEDYRLERKTFIVKIEPMGAVRLNHSCRWKKSPAVLRYFAYKDRLREEIGVQPVPDGLEIEAWMRMPASWPEKKRKKMEGFPHRQKCDADNAIKAIQDSLWTNDQRIWSVKCRKFWACEGQLKIILIYWREKI